MDADIRAMHPAADAITGNGSGIDRVGSEGDPSPDAIAVDGSAIDRDGPDGDPSPDAIAGGGSAIDRDDPDGDPSPDAIAGDGSAIDRVGPDGDPSPDAIAGDGSAIDRDSATTSGAGHANAPAGRVSKGPVGSTEAFIGAREMAVERLRAVVGSPDFSSTRKPAPIVENSL